MSIQNIKKMASSLSKIVDDNEKMPLHTLSAKLNDISNKYPEDHTIGMMNNIVSKMLGNNKLFISKAEVKELYNKLYSRNTKFAEFFGNEIGSGNKLATPKLYDRVGTSENDATENMYDGVDPVLAASLHNAFGNSKHTYSTVAADNAKKVCVTKLSELSPSVSVVDGDEKIVICLAAFDTPKGITNVFVPVEIHTNGKAFTPSMFIGNAGVEDISITNIKNYVIANAGNKLNISSATILSTINSMQEDVIINDVDLALTKLNASKENKSEYTSASYIVGQSLSKEASVKDVVMPQYKDAEALSFAEALDTASGFAAFKFSAEKVNIGKDIIAKIVSNAGVKNYQIAVCSSNDNTISYAISLNSGKTAFKVPVKIDNGNVIPPTVMISNGSIENLSKKGIEDLLIKNNTDHRMAAVASPIYELKASELVNIVRKSAEEENYDKAEDALNVLMQVGDEKAYQTAFAAYSSILTGKTSKAEVCGCNFIIKNATSSHPICGHTNLPLHKVYSDKHGNCRPIYRKGMDETYEGAYFSNSKIFL